MFGMVQVRDKVGTIRARNALEPVKTRDKNWEPLIKEHF
jgi:hypothetical protein